MAAFADGLMVCFKFATVVCSFHASILRPQLLSLFSLSVFPRPTENHFKIKIIFTFGRRIKYAAARNSVACQKYIELSSLKHSLKHYFRRNSFDLQFTCCECVFCVLYKVDIVVEYDAYTTLFMLFSEKPRPYSSLIASRRGSKTKWIELLAAHLSSKEVD